MWKLVGLAAALAASLVPALAVAHPPGSSYSQQNIVHCHVGDGPGAVYVKPPLSPLIVGIQETSDNPVGVEPYTEPSGEDSHAGQNSCV